MTPELVARYIIDGGFSLVAVYCGYRIVKLFLDIFYD
jgi:hypothetical protein